MEQIHHRTQGHPDSLSALFSLFFRKPDNQHIQWRRLLYFIIPISLFLFMTISLLVMNMKLQHRVKELDNTLTRQRTKLDSPRTRGGEDERLTVMKMVKRTDGAMEMKQVHLVVQKEEQDKPLNRFGKPVSFGDDLDLMMEDHQSSSTSVAGDGGLVQELMKAMQHLKQEEVEEVKQSVLNQIQTNGGRDLVNDLKIASRREFSQKKTHSKFRYHNTYLAIERSDTTQSSWLFEDVCMNHKGEIVFFVDWKIKDLSLQLQEHLYKAYENRKNIFSVQGWRRGERGLTNVKVHVNEDLNDEEMQSTPHTVPWIEKPVVAVNRYSTGNIGSMIADNLVSWYELIGKFGFDASEVIPLFMDEIYYRNCEIDTTDPVAVENNMCSGYQASFFTNKTQAVLNSLQWVHLMTKQPVLQRCSYRVFEGGLEENGDKLDSQHLVYRVESAPCPLDDKFSENSKARTTMLEVEPGFNKDKDTLPNVCFKKLIVGVGDRAMTLDRNFAKFRELPILRLRETIMDNLSLSKKTNPHGKLIVAIHDKPTEGSISNLHSLMVFLKDKINNEPMLTKYGIGYGQDRQVELIAVELQKLNLVEQIELFSSIDVYISSNGYGSFLSLFMPDDSFLLYAPECSRPGADVSGEYVCTQPSIYFQTSLPHMSVVDIQYAVRDCKYRNSPPTEKELCDVVLDQHSMYQEIVHALVMRAQ